MAQILSLIIGYFIGALVQTSYWYGKRQNVDIRNYGSGNAGTTNAMRTLGKKAGVITAVGDILKVFLSALICWAIFRGTGMSTILIFLYSGLGTVLGHNFPFFMKFRGGKGIATTAGVIISLFFQPNALWVMTLIGVITFFGVLILTRYVSLASLVLVTEFLIEFIIWSGSGNTALRGRELAQGICLVIIIVALCYLRHVGNIERLLDGNERRFGEKKEAVRRPRVSERDEEHEETPVYGAESDFSPRARRERQDTEPEEEKYYSYDDAYEDEEILNYPGDKHFARSESETIEDEEAYAYDEDYESDAAGADDLHIPDEADYSEASVADEAASSLKKDTSPVRKIQDDEITEDTPKRKFIWDAEKQCYVRFKDSDN